MKKNYPCDYLDGEGRFNCPYDAQSMSACEFNCGYGVEDDIEEEGPSKEEIKREKE